MVNVYCLLLLAFCGCYLLIFLVFWLKFVLFVLLLLLLLLLMLLPLLLLLLFSLKRIFSCVCVQMGRLLDYDNALHFSSPTYRHCFLSLSLSRARPFSFESFVCVCVCICLWNRSYSWPRIECVVRLPWFVFHLIFVFFILSLSLSLYLSFILSVCSL